MKMRKISVIGFLGLFSIFLRRNVISEGMSVPVDGEIEVEMLDASIRVKKDLTLEERGEQCKALELSQKSFSMASDVLGDMSSAAQAIPVLGNLAAAVISGINIVTHMTSGGLDIAQTALDCADVNFDQIKEIMNKRFNALDRKLDQNTAMLEKVSKLLTKTISVIEETRKEMSERFDEVLVSIENAKIEPIISQINNFIQYFEIESEKIRGLKRDEYITKLREKPNILVFLKDLRTPKGGNLHDPLFSIILQNYAVPKGINDEIAFKALYALMYGTQTYFSVFLFLLEQYFYLASYHYERAEIDEYKECFDKINIIFSEFVSSLIGTSTLRKDPLIDSVIQVLSIVKSKDFAKFNKDNLFEKLSQKIDIFQSLKDDIQNMQLPLVKDTPNNYAVVSFEKNIKTDIGKWMQGKSVRYAVQYQSENASHFSQVSEWSDVTAVQAKACPTLTFPTDRKTILIFRKFEGDFKSELVGSLYPSHISFIDIDRDLYNAAENSDVEAGFKEAKTFLRNGANLSTVFEKGRGMLHAAAKSGNINIMFDFVLSTQFTSFDIRDRRGYFPIHIAAQTGKSGIVKFLLLHNASVNAKTNRGLTPLHIAAQSGFILTVKSLIESPKININEIDEYGFTPLHCAIRGGRDVTEAFIHHGGLDISVKSKNGLTPFHLAVINDDLSVAQLLMSSKKVDVNSGDNTNMTPLHYATMLGNTKLVRYLTALRETNTNAMTEVNNWSPLHYAIFFKKDDAALELLKDNRVDKNLKAGGKATPLHFAVTFERKRIVSALVAGKVPLEEKTADGYTALHLASMRKDIEIIFILINGTASIEAKTNNGLTPLQLATFAGRSKIVLYLLKRGADFMVADKDGNMPLHVAALTDQWEVVRAIIDGYSDGVNVMNKNGETALNLATQNGHIVIVRLLIERGAAVNAKNREGVTPLSHFVKTGNLEMVKYLVHHDANVYTTDEDGINILYYSIERSHLDIIKYIIGENKFDWNEIENMRTGTCSNVVCHEEECAQRCPMKYFAFCDAIGYGKLDVLKYFMDTLNQSECDPLHFASRYGQLDIVKYLIEDKKMKVDGEKAKPYNTPLCFAAKAGYLDVAEYLVEKKANISTICEDKLTAIDLAIRNGNIDIVKFLSKNGANLRNKNELKYTPFMMAFIYGRNEILKYFLKNHKKNIDINERDENYRSVLHLAVMTNQFELVKLFVENGIDIWIPDYDMKIAQDYATNRDIYLYLESHSRRFVRETKIGSKNYNLLYGDLIYTSMKVERIEDSYQKYKYANVKSEGSNIKARNTDHPNVDIIGTLLLLNVIIRYFTNQIYISDDQSVAGADVQTAAMKITANFEDLLTFIGNLPDEKMNISEMHKTINKTLKSDNKKQIHQILCSPMKSLSSLKPDEQEKLISEFISGHPANSVLEVSLLDIKNILEATLYSLTYHCLDLEGKKNVGAHVKISR